MLRSGSTIDRLVLFLIHTYLHTHDSLYTGAGRSSQHTPTHYAVLQHGLDAAAMTKLSVRALILDSQCMQPTAEMGA